MEQEKEITAATSVKTPKWAIIAIVILSLAVAGLGYEVWTINQQKAEVAKQKTALQDQKADIQKQLDDARAAIAKATSAKTTTTTTTVSSASSDSEAVAKAYELQSAHNSTIDQVVLKAASTQGNFIRYSVSIKGEPGGSAIIVKKVGSVWIPVSNGQEPPSKATGEMYGLPSGWYSTSY